MRLDRRGRGGLVANETPDSVWLYPLPEALVEACRYGASLDYPIRESTNDSFKGIAERRKARNILAPAKSKAVVGGVSIPNDELSLDRVLYEVVNVLPNEVAHIHGTLEGHAKQIWVDKYERSVANRNACLAIHGEKCIVCEFDSAVAYPPGVPRIIHVHHRNPLGVLKQAHVPNPGTDLCPVCPNCHAAIHSRPGNPFTPEDLRALMGRPPRG